MFVQGYKVIVPKQDTWFIFFHKFNQLQQSMIRQLSGSGVEEFFCEKSCSTKLISDSFLGVIKN